MFAQDLNAPRRRTTRRGWIASLISLALIVSILAALLAFSALAAEPVAPQIFYLKDGQVYYRDFAQAAPVQVTQQLFADGDPGAYPKDNALTHLVGDFDRWTAEAIEADPMRYSGFLSRQQNKLSDVFRYSEDGTRILYLDRMGYRGTNHDYDCGDLYFRDLSDPEEEPRLIADGVTSFTADPDLALVTYYVRAPKGNLAKNGLRRCNLETGEQQFIQNGQLDYQVSEDGALIAFTNAGMLFVYSDESGLKCITDTADDADLEVNADFTQIRLNANGDDRYYAMDGTELAETQAGGFPLMRGAMHYRCGSHTYSFSGPVLWCDREELTTCLNDFGICDKFAACLAEGTLYLLRGTKMIPIAEHVLDFELYEDGSILYQVNGEDFTGDLYYWFEGESALLLEDISYFLHDSEELRRATIWWD